MVRWSSGGAMVLVALSAGAPACSGPGPAAVAPPPTAAPVATAPPVAAPPPSASPGDKTDPRYELVQHPKLALDPDFTPFYAAGCDQYKNCGQTYFARLFSCHDVWQARGLGGLTPTLPIITCVTDLTEGLFTVGGLSGRGITYVVLNRGSPEQIATKEEFLRRFAPVETKEEAISFVAALNRHIEVWDELPDTRTFHILVPRIETAYAAEAGGGFDVHVFESGGFGCGPKPHKAVDFHVTKAGEITRTKSEPVFEDPRDSGCID